MKSSIRTFLLINLLLSAILITSLAIIGNLFLAHRDIESQLNTQLNHNAEQIQSFFSDDLSKRNLQKIQKNLNAMTIKSPSTSIFQLWNEKGELLLHSHGAPTTPFSKGVEGPSSILLNNRSWHVYTIKNPENKLTIMVAERGNYREELENQLTEDSILVMLITYPFLALLTWFIVGRGLDSLKKVAEEVKHREPHHLKPVDFEKVPAEIEPLVSELNSLFLSLQEAFEREKRFTADAAHELRTPLAALTTQVQVALRATTPDDRNQALMKVLTGVNRGTHVVHQLLTLSRMDPQANIQEPQPVILAKQAADVAAQLAPEAIAKNIDLELLEPDNPATIMGNATAINILLRNLVDNAIRYSPENSFVKIDIQETDSSIILIVIDNGPGIPEELRERVFERFFRITGTKTTGSGLGLGIVHQIVKLHQAEVKLLTPTSGQGLEVRIIFPKIPSKMKEYDKRS